MITILCLNLNVASYLIKRCSVEYVTVTCAQTPRFRITITNHESSVWLDVKSDAGRNS